MNDMVITVRFPNPQTIEVKVYDEAQGDRTDPIAEIEHTNESRDSVAVAIMMALEQIGG